MKTVTIIRKPYMPDYYRDYQVFSNSKLIGKISLDSQFNFTISSNSVIYLKIDWCRSNKILIDETFSDDILLEVYPSGRGWRMLIYLYYLTLGWRKYLTLKVLKK